MEIKEIITELKVVQHFFEEQSGGSCPLCILEATKRLEAMEGENAN